jgi:hypothetical protein
MYQRYEISAFERTGIQISAIINKCKIKFLAAAGLAVHRRRKGKCRFKFLGRMLPRMLQVENGFLPDRAPGFS